MGKLMFLICLLEFILQIKYLKSDDKWSYFLGINLSYFILAILIFFIYLPSALGLSDAVGYAFVSIVLALASLILFIIGLVKKRGKEKELKGLLKSFLITFSVNLFVFFIMPFIIKYVSYGIGWFIIEKQLEEKYGGEYSFVKVQDTYSDEGIVVRYVSGYVYEVKSSYMDESFCVEISDDYSYIEHDYFLQVYYSLQNDFDYKCYLSNFGIVDNFSQLEDYIKNKVAEKNILENKTCKVGLYDMIWYKYNYGKVVSLDEYIDLLYDYGC